MKYAGPDIAEMAANVSRNYSPFAAFIADWRDQELGQLPNVSVEKVTLAQGRCQVLIELTRLMAPELAAKVDRTDRSG